jgi:hypothetical protein
MKAQAEVSVPTQLQELLQLTPSGVAKLVAAWDGLALETQVAILALTKSDRGPAYLYRRIAEKALTSDNPFVRYLAAREIRSSGSDTQEDELTRKITSDPEPLVRYARFEAPYRFELSDTKAFFALPHDARLAKVRRLPDCAIPARSRVRARG